MGRKPNPIILEFFERGPKLADASNRYQHTCRACREKFPKGRIDSLTTHLLKKCLHISSQDRRRAVHQLHDLPDPDGSDGSRGSQRRPRRRAAQLAFRRVDDGHRPGHGFAAAAPPDAGHNWPPLETLAEASRQFELSEKRASTPQDFVDHGHPPGEPPPFSDEPHGIFEETQPDLAATMEPRVDDWLTDDSQREWARTPPYPPGLVPAPSLKLTTFLRRHRPVTPSQALTRHSDQRSPIVDLSPALLLSS